MNGMKAGLRVAVLLGIVLVPRAEAQVLDHQKISATEGGFTGDLGTEDYFGRAVASLGDLDGDGITDLAVGAPGDDDVLNAGAVWILFLNADGTVKSHAKISATEGGFAAALDPADRFGGALAALGDVDGDGVTDLAVGAAGDDDGDSNAGAVWVLFLHADGTVKALQKLSAEAGSFAGELDSEDGFGSAVSALGDLDGNGVTDLAVGAPRDNDGAGTPTDRKGAVWLLFLDTDGTVMTHGKISATQGGFTGELAADSFFGKALARIGDLDGDGATDIGVASRDAVWILFLTPGGSVARHARIDEAEGGFADCFDYQSSIEDLEPVGDLNGDGVLDLALGTSSSWGTIWLLCLHPDGRVETQRKVSYLQGGFDAGGVSGLGASMARIVDLDGNGVADLVAGAWREDDGGGTLTGAVYTLFLDALPSLPPTEGLVHCSPANANSTGQPGTMYARWRTVVSNPAFDSLLLVAGQLPPGNIGYFIAGQGTNQYLPPGSVGPICVLPGLVRLRAPIGHTDQLFDPNTLTGGFKRCLSLADRTTLGLTGSTWSFQAWHRDGMGPSNLSEAVSVFLP